MLGKRKVPARAYVASFNFKGPDQEKKVGQLSGGERNRVHLAKLLKSGGNLLLLDEPTNDLDVEMLRALEEALIDFGGCAVVITHDRWFLDRIATHILAFEGDSQVVWCDGNYQTYEAQRHERLGTDADQPHRIRYKALTAVEGIRTRRRAEARSARCRITCSSNRNGGIVRLTLNRPEKRNALSSRAAAEPRGRDRGHRGRSVGAGGRARLARAGLLLGSRPGGDGRAERGRLSRAVRALLAGDARPARLPQPVIARVQGVATAAGCQLVAACDLAVAAEEATFATPGVKIGLFCTTPMVPLVRAIPAKAAMEMLLTGDADLGPARPGAGPGQPRGRHRDELDPTIQSLAETIAAMSPLVIRTGKRAFYEIEGLDEPEAYDRAVPIMTANALFQRRPGGDLGVPPEASAAMVGELTRCRSTGSTACSATPTRGPSR